MPDASVNKTICCTFREKEYISIVGLCSVWTKFHKDVSRVCDNMNIAPACGFLKQLRIFWDYIADAEDNCVRPEKDIAVLKSGK